MEQYTDIELSNGTVIRVEVVPTSLVLDIVMQRPGLRELPRPVRTVRTKTGAMEELGYNDDEPEIAAWQTENARREATQVKLHELLAWQLGVTEWKLSGSSKFTAEVPKGWKIPAKWQRLVDTFNWEQFSDVIDVRWLCYVRYYLCGNESSTVTRALSQSGPLTNAEVDAASATFQGVEEGSAN